MIVCRKGQPSYVYSTPQEPQELTIPTPYIQLRMHNRVHLKLQTNDAMSPLAVNRLHRRGQLLHKPLKLYIHQTQSCIAT